MKWNMKGFKLAFAAAVIAVSGLGIAQAMAPVASGPVTAGVCSKVCFGQCGSIGGWIDSRTGYCKCCD